MGCWVIEREMINRRVRFLRVILVKGKGVGVFICALVREVLVWFVGFYIRISWDLFIKS